MRVDWIDLFFELGPSVNPAELRRLEVGGTVRKGSTINAHIVHVDNFGNLITSIPLAAVPELYTVSQVKIAFKENGVTVENSGSFLPKDLMMGKRLSLVIVLATLELRFVMAMLQKHSAWD